MQQRGQGRGATIAECESRIADWERSAKLMRRLDAAFHWASAERAVQLKRRQGGALHTLSNRAVSPRCSFALKRPFPSDMLPAHAQANSYE